MPTFDFKTRYPTLGNRPEYTKNSRIPVAHRAASRYVTKFRQSGKEKDRLTIDQPAHALKTRHREKREIVFRWIPEFREFVNSLRTEQAHVHRLHCWKNAPARSRMHIDGNILALGMAATPSQFLNESVSQPQR